LHSLQKEPGKLPEDEQNSWGEGIRTCASGERDYQPAFGSGLAYLPDCAVRPRKNLSNSVPGASLLLIGPSIKRMIATVPASSRQFFGLHMMRKSHVKGLAMAARGKRGTGNKKHPGTDGQGVT
jgi:hypothetical protein